MCFEARTCLDLPNVSQISEECRNLKEGWSQGCEQPKEKKTSTVVSYCLWQKENYAGKIWSWMMQIIKHMNHL